MKIKILFVLTVIFCSSHFAFCKSSLSNQAEALKEEIELFSKNKDSKNEQQEVKRSLILMGMRHLEVSVAKEIANKEKKIVRLKQDFQEYESYSIPEEDEYDEYSSQREYEINDRAEILEKYKRKIEQKEKSLLELKELQINLERLKNSI